MNDDDWDFGPNIKKRAEQVLAAGRSPGLPRGDDRDVQEAPRGAQHRHHEVPGLATRHTYRLLGPRPPTLLTEGGGRGRFSDPYRPSRTPDDRTARPPRRPRRRRRRHRRPRARSPCAAGACSGRRGVALAGDIEVAAGLGPVTIVVNPGAGSADGVDLDGVPVRELGEGEDLDAVLRGLADEGVAVLGVAGGDGSVGCAAQVALDRDRVLWVVPGGHAQPLRARPRPVRRPRRPSRACPPGGSPPSTSATPTASPSSTTPPSASTATWCAAARPSSTACPSASRCWSPPRRILRTARPRSRWRSTASADRVYLVFAGNNPYTGAGLTGRESLQAGLLDVRVLSGEPAACRASPPSGRSSPRPTAARAGSPRACAPGVTVRLREPARPRPRRRGARGLPARSSSQPPPLPCASWSPIPASERSGPSAACATVRDRAPVAQLDRATAF